jgi:hypothetical protein
LCPTSDIATDRGTPARRPPAGHKCEQDAARQLACLLATVLGGFGGSQGRTDAIDLIPIEEAAARVALV